MSGHLGDSLSALVDGELDHAARERALAHLAHCAACRGEVDAHRRLKASLASLRQDPPLPPAGLAARLLAVPSGAVAPAPPPPGRRAARRAPHPLTRSRALHPRRAAAAGVLVVAGLVGAVALGSPASRGPAAPVDPAGPELLVDHISTTSEVPLTEPAFATVLPAGSPAGAGR